MYRKRVLSSRRVGAFASAMALLVGCSVKQQSDPAGPGCGASPCDAGLEEPELVPELIDGGALDDVIEEQSDAGAVDICPGMCIPDLATECADVAEPIDVDGMSFLLLAPTGQFDAGAVLDGAEAAPARLASSDAGSDESAVRGLPDASVDEHAGDGGVGGPSSGTDDAAPGADAGRPIEPVDLADAGEPLNASDAGPGRYSCQMTHGQSGVRASCAPAGNGGMGETCSSGGDCAPGFACVQGRLGSGQCQPYCCGGKGSCEAGQICAERPLVADGMPDEMEYMVPVCSIPDQCDLSDPYPCPSGEHCSCPTGYACSVVGRDGAKACVEPGIGMEGDACPCAAGYFCSPQREQCIKLCKFGGDACGRGKCQGVGGFPEGIGLCVEVGSGQEEP